MEVLERLEEEESILQELRAPVCRCCRSRLGCHGKFGVDIRHFGKALQWGQGGSNGAEPSVAITAPRASIFPPLQ